MVQYVANRYLHEQQLVLALEKLHVNPFNAQVTLTSLMVSHEQSILFSLDHISADIDFWALLNGQIIIDDVTLDSAQLSAALSQGQLNFGGWQPLPSKTTKQAEQSAQSTIPKLIVKQLRIINVEATLQAQREHQLNIALLAAQNIEIENGALATSFKLASQLNNRPIDIAGAIGFSSNDRKIELSKLMANVALSDFQQWLPLDVNALTADVTLDAVATVTQNNENWQLAVDQLAVRAQEVFVPVTLGSEPSELSIAQLDVKAHDTVMRLNKGFSLVDGKSEVNMSLHSLNLQQSSAEIELANIDNATIEQLQLTLGEQNTLSLSQLLLNEGRISQLKRLPSIILDDGAIPEPLTVFNQIALANLTYTDNKLAIDDIVVDASQITFYKSAEHGIENLYQIREKSEKQQAKSPSEPAELLLTIGQIRTSGQSRIDLFDFTPHKPVAHQILINELKLTNINSMPGALADLQVNAGLDKRSELVVQGKLNPISVTKNSQISAKISGVNLAKYSPYVEDAIDYGIKQGVLFAEIEMAIVDDNVSGNVDTNIKAIELSKVKNVQPSKSNEVSTSIIPIDTALKQLTDEQGNMDVEIPLTGSIHDPKFGLGGFISILTTKAIKQGAKNYLIQSFLPYAHVVTIAMMAGDTLFDVKIKPLAYQYNQIELGEEQFAFAKELALALKDKPSLQLAVCAQVVPEFTNEGAALSDKELIAYQRQGDNRVEQFIDYLVEQEGVSSERLIPCQATVSTNAKDKNNLHFTLK